MKKALMRTLVVSIAFIIIIIITPMALYYYKPHPIFVGFIALLLFIILIFNIYKENRNQLNKQEIESEKEKVIDKLKQEVDKYESLKSKLLKLPKDIREKYEI